MGEGLLECWSTPAADEFRELEKLLGERELPRDVLQAVKRMARQQSGIGLSETQLRERLNKLQELHILPEHRAHPSLQDPDRPGEVSAWLIKDLFKALGIDWMLANRPVAGKHFDGYSLASQKVWGASAGGQQEANYYDFVTIERLLERRFPVQNSERSNNFLISLF